MSEHESFYVFDDNSSYTRGFTWAMSIITRSAIHHRECSTCGAVEHYPSGAFDVIVEGGAKYPDILGCGAYPFLIVSELVVTAWQQASITCFHTFPVGIAEVKSKKLRDQPRPQYFRVEIDGRCDIDLVASGVKLIRICPECQRIIEQPTLPHERSYRMKPGSWDGCAIFRDAVLYPRVSFCTEQMLKVAGQHRFTNFRFEAMEGPFDSASKGIDYLKRSR